MDNLSFQLASRQDIPRLIELFSESEEYHRANRPDVFAQPPRAELQKLYEKFVQDPQVTTVLAIHKQQTVGFLRYRSYDAPRSPFLAETGSQHAMIEELVVTQAQRRNGIGESLIKEAETRLREKGIQQIHLNVFTFNRGAQALYEGQGYRPLYSRLGKTLE